MADIPVEKESGSAWWAWLLGLLALAVLVWVIWAWAADGEGEETIATGEDVEAVDPGANAGDAGGGVITDYTTILEAEDRRALIGREVRLANMHVRSVPGDSVFYVSPQEDVPIEPGNRFVIAELDEVIPASPPGEEGRYDVTEGQTLTIYGSVQGIEEEHPKAWGITQQEANQMLEEDQIYVRAQRLEITEMAEASTAEGNAP